MDGPKDLYAPKDSHDPADSDKPERPNDSEKPHEAKDSDDPKNANQAETSGNPNDSPSQPTSPLSAAAYETTHVHTVYEQIAPHFSSTRYKPWPLIRSFLLSLPPGSIGLDVGCGNGKYLLVNPDIYLIGSDRSANLVGIARNSVHSSTAPSPPVSVSQNDEKDKETEIKAEDGDGNGEMKRLMNDVAIADGLSIPHPTSRFDFAICVAVVHHLSTRTRRQEAIRELLRPLKPNGKALVYVWALEQGGSRRGWDESNEQDVMVPWVMKTKKKDLKEGEAQEKVFQRFYHLYRKGELEEDVREVGGVVLEGGYERDNWWVIATNGE